MPTFDFSSAPYQAFKKRTSSPSRPRPESASTPVQSPGIDLASLIAAFSQMSQQQQQGDLSAQREQQGGIHRDISGRPIDQTAQQGPWSGPIMFKSPEERYAEMAGYPVANVPPRTDVSNPYFAGPVPAAPAPTPAAPAPQVGSPVPGAQPGMFDIVGPTSATSGGGNILGSVMAGSATAAPVGPGMTATPAGNAVMAPPKPKTPKPAAQRPRPGQGGFVFPGFR